jgi:hypothetical protein
MPVYRHSDEMDSTKRRRDSRGSGLNLRSNYTFLFSLSLLAFTERSIWSTQFLTRFHLLPQQHIPHPFTQNHYTFHQYLVSFFQLLKVMGHDLLLPTAHVTDLLDFSTCKSAVQFCAGYYCPILGHVLL